MDSGERAWVTVLTANILKKLQHDVKRPHHVRPHHGVSLISSGPVCRGRQPMRTSIASYHSWMSEPTPFLSLFLFISFFPQCSGSEGGGRGAGKGEGVVVKLFGCTLLAVKFLLNATTTSGCLIQLSSFSIPLLCSTEREREGGGRREEGGGKQTKVSLFSGDKMYNSLQKPQAAKINSKFHRRIHKRRSTLANVDGIIMQIRVYMCHFLLDLYQTCKPGLCCVERETQHFKTSN